MSIKRLNASERVTYLFGLAVRRQIEQAPQDPDTRREVDAVFRWAEHWLSSEELFFIAEETGHLIGDTVLDGLQLPPDRPAADEPDDVPF